MSVSGDVMEQIANGVHYIDDIAAATGYTNKQIYDVCKVAVNRGTLNKIIPGFNGAYVIPGQSLQPRRTAMAAAPQLAAPVVPNACFDFNASINDFVGQMTQQIVGQIRTQVQVEISTLGLEVEKTVTEMVRTASSGVINKIVGQLSVALGGIQTEIQQPQAPAEIVKPPVVEAPVTVAVTTEAPINVVDLYADQKPPAIMAVEQQKNRLPKILVTNLLPVQCGLLTAEFGETFDLLFWNDRTGSSAQQLREYSQSAKVIFWHVKHSSHSSENTARKHNTNMIRVKGDMTAMREAIREYYNTHYAPRTVAAVG